MRDGLAAELISVALLLAVLAVVVGHRKRWWEAPVAVAAAGMALLLGLVHPSGAAARAVELLPTLGFLAAVLLLSHLAAEEGVFSWLGARLGAAARGGPRRLLLLTFFTASVTTAVLSLDATVLLLTPVVVASARAARMRVRPHAFACGHLANSASTLMPVSNLTNLLAFGSTGLTFLGFTALMALPWIATIAVEMLVFTLFFASDLRTTRTEECCDADASPAGDPVPQATPLFTLTLLAAVLVGFLVTSLAGLRPVWVTAAGALVLACHARIRLGTRIRVMVAETAPAFLLFVLALAIVVQAVGSNGLGAALARILPATATLPALAFVALVAAVLANLVNNLPAVLVMLPALGAQPHAGIVLAVLLGVNLGPNAGYLGSLATLLWRRVLSSEGAGTDAAPKAREFFLLGACTVPVALAVAVLALWLGLRVAGLSP